MALKETYLARWKEIPKDAKGIAVTRTAKSLLAPSQALLKDWKTGKISWSDYETRYRKEMLGSPRVMEYLGDIKRQAETMDIYLVCYEKKPPCHRFLLLDILEELN